MQTVKKTSPKKKRFSFKKIAAFLHLWLGLASGIVIFIVCITAAIWAFSPEIENLTQPYRHVAEENKPYLLPSQLQAVAAKQLPGKPVRSISYEDKDKAVIAYFYDSGYYNAVYLNPYTGAALKTKDEENTFFSVVITGHYTLWLGEVGGQIVKWATLIFGIGLVTGIVLWWPKNKAARKQRFKVKWDASPKRLNYDLHNVFGFYAAWIAIFATITGLVWTFESISDAEYWLASGGKTAPKYEEALSKTAAKKTLAFNAVDSVYTRSLQLYKNKITRVNVSLPDSDSAAIGVSVFPTQGVYYNGDHYHYDQYTLAEIPVASYGRYANANGGEKLSRMNYDIHLGSIIGLPGRVAMFLAVLIGASLPVTGFYIWWGRKKKGKKKVVVGAAKVSRVGKEKVVIG